MGQPAKDDGALFAAARVAEGFTQEAAATRAEVSESTYINHERAPELFRLIELKRLYQGYSPTGQEILMNAIRSLFLSK